jgi:hypothetical protein
LLPDPSELKKYQKISKNIKKYQKHTTHNLKAFFFQKHSKLPFLAEEAQMKKKKLKNCIFNLKILP